MADETHIIIVKAGDHIDTLALRAFGDVNKYPLLLHANPELDIWDSQPGIKVEVPDA